MRNRAALLASRCAHVNKMLSEIQPSIELISKSVTFLPT